MEQVFVAHLEKNRGLIYSIINAYCPDQTYRDDLYQEFVLNAWKAFPKFKEQSKISTWLGRIARNVAVDHHRKAKLPIILKENIFYDIIIADEPYSEQEIPVIDKLTEKEKTTLNLYMDGLSLQGIAEKTGDSYASIRVRMHRIKKELAKSIKNSLN